MGPRFAVCLTKCKCCSKPFRQYSSLQTTCSFECGKKLKEKKDGKLRSDTTDTKTCIEPDKAVAVSYDVQKGSGAPERKGTSHNNVPSHKSKKQASKDSVIASLKNQYVQAHGMVCQSCEDEGQIDVSHIMKKSVRPELYTDPDNLMMQCRACHNSYEDLQDIERVKRFLNLAEILDYLERTDTKRYNRITEKLKATNKNDKGRI